ncbi:hypothetical protein CAL7716_102240 (plasmid) [Calothrix sp. PCC 7716]|nr:hypothetical protein CAL7716_102240 [Calothrix sp. PCC 7716]
MARSKSKKHEQQTWNSYTSYIFEPHPDCMVTVYGSTNCKTIAVHDGQEKSISLKFSKNTVSLLESYVQKLQKMLIEIKAN